MKDYDSVHDHDCMTDSWNNWIEFTVVTQSRYHKPFWRHFKPENFNSPSKRATCTKFVTIGKSTTSNVVRVCLTALVIQLKILLCTHNRYNKILRFRTEERHSPNTLRYQDRSLQSDHCSCKVHIYPGTGPRRHWHGDSLGHNATIEKMQQYIK